VDIKFQINRTTERGATAVQMLVIMVPLLFGMIGFAVDLGMLYSVKGELKEAANAMALAAAQRLNGTDGSTGAATTAAQLTIENTSGFGNRYDFNGRAIGQTTGTSISTVSDPVYFSSVSDAVATTPSSEVTGATAKHVRITITGQRSLLFWSFLPLLTDRNVAVLATAVAGISAPLCVACGIEPFAVAAIDQGDATDFGFTLGTKYSFTYLCTGAPTPALLPPGTQMLNYVILNRLDPNTAVFPDEASQAFRAGAGGLPGNTSSAQACFTINTSEIIWTNAAVNTCSANQVAPVVTEALCGLDTRFESDTQAACQAITGVEVLSTVYQPDTDVNDYDTYNDYGGDGRRIITIPIVDTVSGAASMNVLGFRQFLVSPSLGAANISTNDPFGRFVAMYIGSVAPVKQGRFDGCQQIAGPGKVVLHQ
jgi:Flp pilus assembly protein TadG